MLAHMENLYYFGLLTGFTIIVAFVADVTVSPALMALAHRPRKASRARVGERRTRGSGRSATPFALGK
jgi:uncharacterized membrane protein YdfJ with MMPL/SSD domain